MQTLGGRLEISRDPGEVCDVCTFILCISLLLFSFPLKPRHFQSCPAMMWYLDDCHIALSNAWSSWENWVQEMHKERSIYNTVDATMFLIFMFGHLTNSSITEIELSYTGRLSWS